MQTITFDTNIKNGIIQIPEKLQGKVSNSVRVILISKSGENSQTDMIEELMANPIHLKDFKPLTRDEANERG